jgi:hypothetical protein
MVKGIKMNPKEKIEQYLDSNGWKNTPFEVLEFKNRLIKMYLDEYNHNIEMNKRLKDIKSLSYKFTSFNFIENESKLNELKNLETEDEILEFSIDSVNSIISSFFKSEIKV